jgi:transposase
MMGPKRRLKQWRSVATRYEERAVNYPATVVIASPMVWLPREPSGAL